MAEQLSTLEENKNPFAVCTLAHFKAMETTHSPVDRKKWKYNLTIGLYKRGYSREDIIKLFSFIDWILSLPDELEANFLEEIYRYEEECKMPYVTSAERMGVQKGLQQGLQQGLLQEAREMVLDAFDAKFGQVPSYVHEKVGAMTDRQKLKQILRTVIRAKNLEEVEKEITWN